MALLTYSIRGLRAVGDDRRAAVETAVLANDPIFAAAARAAAEQHAVQQAQQAAASSASLPALTTAVADWKRWALIGAGALGLGAIIYLIARRRAA